MGQTLTLSEENPYRISFSGAFQPSRRPRLITLTETLIIFRISQKTESNNCFLIHCFEENNDKHRRKEPDRLVSYLLADN